jgi:hypothetical protein
VPICTGSPFYFGGASFELNPISSFNTLSFTRSNPKVCREHPFNIATKTFLRIAPLLPFSTGGRLDIDVEISLLKRIEVGTEYLSIGQRKSLRNWTERYVQ